MPSIIHPPSALALMIRDLQQTIDECGVRSLTEPEIVLIADRALRPTVTDPVTGFLNGRYRYELLREALSWTAKTGKPVFYVEFDMKNIGGGNARLGHQGCNVRIIQPLASLIDCAVSGLANVPDGWSILFRHGGDECSALIGGVSNDRAAGRPLTRALDTLVRSSHEYAMSAGLDLLPNPKYPFRLSKRGTGLYYGFAAVEAGNDPREIFSAADRRLEQYKRGLAPGAPYPLKLTWAKRRQMLWALLQNLVGKN